MIQINLIPDVKQELLRAQRQRNTVVSLAITVGIAAVSAVALGAAFVFGGQTVASSILDGRIDDESKKLLAVEDLSSALTIQNQLKVLGQTHDTKQIDSRLFDVIAAITPPAPNNVTISSFVIDPEAGTITIEAQAEAGYTAAETFTKTIRATTVSFSRDAGESETVPLTESVSLGDGGFGENAEGRRVLRFNVSFEYAPDLFSSTTDNVRIESPTGQENATDSYTRVPESIFEDRAPSTGGNE